MTKKIAVVGTLDTKEMEIQFVKELIEGKGHVPVDHRLRASQGALFGPRHLPTSGCSSRRTRPLKPFWRPAIRTMPLAP